MKSTLITLGAIAALAYLGSFFELWRLPHQRGDHFTYRNAYQKMKKAVSYEEDMYRDARDENIEDQERIFKEGK